MGWKDTHLGIEINTSNLPFANSKIDVLFEASTPMIFPKIHAIVIAWS